MLTPQEFINLFPGAYIQTFDDAKQGIAPVRCQPYAGNWEELTRWNEAGAGVFFSPNPCEGGRAESNVTALKWAFIDMDHGGKEWMRGRIAQSPVLPSLVVESKRGYHVYFRADISRENWGRLISGLIQFFDADEALSSMNEVLRLPGFYHRKDISEPFLVRIDQVNPVRYTEEELMAAFPFESFEERFKREHGTGLDAIRAIDIRQVLERLQVDVRRNQIFVDGEGTSMMVNVSGNYVNRFSGQPGSGSVIDVVMHFKGCSVREAIEWLSLEFGVELGAGGLTLHPSEFGSDIVREMRSRGATPFTWGTPKLDRELSPIDRGNYIVLGAETGLGKTAFSLFMGMENARRGCKVLYLSLEMANKGLIRRYAREVAGITELDISLGNVEEGKIEAMRGAIGDIPAGFCLHEFPEGTPYTISTIRKLYEEAGGFDMVFIDNLGFIEGKGDEALERQASVSREIVNFCKTYSDRVCVVAIHHFRKGNRGKPRRLDDLMGSAKIGHDVSYSVQLWRNQEAPAAEQSKLAVILQKNREWGKYATSTVYYHKGKFYDEDQRSRGITGSDIARIF